ncbi:tRNA pseudouridine synthase-like 1 [Arctopsyche grandis]|uniref:tRNA pseudouridine synthase-like 1 n=1 Tax=Arctopsyche grandis TaxID=121162 RepID=UPI00406D8BE1
MAFVRYFLRFSYIGTYFRGSQRSNILLDHKSTIEGNFILALRAFNLREGSFTLSSRTDSGVHALNATAHVDFLPRNGKYPDPQTLKIYVNSYFNQDDTCIAVNEVKKVPNTFSARFSAKFRTYIYRLAVIKPDAVKLTDYPIEEWRRCLILRHEKFDINKMQDALKEFEGTHDFETFKKRNADKPWTHCVRTINSIEINPGRPMIVFPNDDICKYFDFWDIKIKSRGFIHNQVRRMVGTGIAAAINKIDLSDIKVMLTVPSYKSWITRVDVVSPFGLYLCQVDYDEEDFLLEDGDVGKEDIYKVSTKSIRSLVRKQEI